VQALSELLGLLSALARLNYRFITVTPATHARLISKRASGRNLRDLLGWSLPTPRELVPHPIVELLEAANELTTEGDIVRSRIRVSSCGDRLFIHSAYPTAAHDSVYLGPDSYRFVRFITRQCNNLRSARHLVDLGCGTGIGGIELGRGLEKAWVTLMDSNEKALRYAAVNARHAMVQVETVLGDGLHALAGEAPDLIIANPPYMMDPEGPAYRDGGGLHGAELSLRWASDALARLAPRGILLLYTGSAIVGGEDIFRGQLEREALRLGCTLSYEEVDPDVFSEQLDDPGYADVERIAAVTAVLKKAD
jgi:methylase of polypeptide subunit release factors